MKCPNCGQDIDGNKSTCDKCGFSLYGPRNLSVDDVYKNNDKGNIKKITGIDIDDIYKKSDAINKLNSNNKKRTAPLNSGKKRNNINFSKIFGKAFFISLSVLLSVLCVVFIFLFLNKETENCPKESCPTVKLSDSNRYVSSGSYFVYLPEGYDFSKIDDLFLISNKNLVMSIYPLVKAKLEFTTASGIKKAYLDLEYEDVVVEEKILNSKKLFVVKYSKSGVYYCNYYYQYDSENVLYGLVYSNNKNINLFDFNIESIINSVVISNNSYVIDYKPSIVDYSSIFSRMN